MILVVGSIGIYQYFRISSSLPDVGELRDRAAQFETTRILDRNGDVLYEIIDPNAGRRTYVSLDEISPYLIAATIATEDKDFYTNPGFDHVRDVACPLAELYGWGDRIGRLNDHPTVGTCTYCWIRSERYEQSYRRKAREIVLGF